MAYQVGNVYGEHTLPLCRSQGSFVLYPWYVPCELLAVCICSICHVLAGGGGCSCEPITSHPHSFFAVVIVAETCLV